jgi:hypothetical protein
MAIAMTTQIAARKRKQQRQEALEIQAAAEEQEIRHKSFMRRSISLRAITRMRSRTGSPSGGSSPSLADHLRQGMTTRPAKKPPMFSCACLGNMILAFMNSLGVQTVLYLAFVLVFQLMANSLRNDQEYYLNKRMMLDFVKTPFDSSHNNFDSIRRTADVYEWGSNVLWPSLFGRVEPCYLFSSDLPNRTCHDHGWADGEGSFSTIGSTGHTIEELVLIMDELDWTDGILIRQARGSLSDACVEAKGTLAFNTPGRKNTCYPELSPGGGSTESYGYNYHNPDLPLSETSSGGAWTHFSSQELGSAPAVTSAYIQSMRGYDTSGYVALVIPFFSDVWLPEQEGPVASIADYRKHSVTRTNTKVAKYFCARISRNGRHVHQLCDPTDKADGKGRTTGNVKLAVYQMWNELKRRHFIDSQTRVVTVHLQLRSNHLGLRYRMQLMMEMSSMGTVLPSYDVETRVLAEQSREQMWFAAHMSLGLVGFFCALELVEVFGSGLTEYLGDLWNMMDWINYIVFFLVYRQTVTLTHTLDNPVCGSYFCREMGYFDDWQAMSEARTLKQLLSLCLCIQLFKLTKFTSQLVPKMSLMSSVLRTCVIDLTFFSIVFMNSIVSFSSMLYISVGPVIPDFYGQFSSFIALFRALFGDFDIQEILDNTSGYLQAILFLMYLFVAIFIMLSLFLAILAEAQGKVREKETEHYQNNPNDSPYGVFVLWSRCIKQIGWLILRLFCPKRAAAMAHEAAVAEADAKAAEKAENAADLEEMRQMPYSELTSAGQAARLNTRFADLRNELTYMSRAVNNLKSTVESYRGSRPPPPLPPHAPPPGWGNPLLDSATNPPVGDSNSSRGQRALSSGADTAGLREEARATREMIEALEAKMSSRLTSLDEKIARRERIDRRAKLNILRQESASRSPSPGARVQAKSAAEGPRQGQSRRAPAATEAKPNESFVKEQSRGRSRRTEEDRLQDRQPDRRSNSSGGRDGSRNGGRDGSRDGSRGTRDGSRDGGRDGRRDGGRDGSRDGGRTASGRDRSDSRGRDRNDSRGRERGATNAPAASGCRDRSTSGRDRREYSSRERRESSRGRPEDAARQRSRAPEAAPAEGPAESRHRSRRPSPPQADMQADVVGRRRSRRPEVPPVRTEQLV